MRNSLAFFAVLLACAALAAAQQPDNRPTQPPGAMRHGYPLPLQPEPPPAPPAEQRPPLPPQPPQGQPPPQHPRPEQPKPPQLPQRRQAPPEPPAQPQQERYYVELNGRAAGPFTLDQVLEHIRAGQVRPRTLVWKPVLTAWVEAASLNELKAEFGSSQPPPVPPETRLKQFMVGVWEVEAHNPNLNTITHTAIRYNLDGSFAGTQTTAMPGTGMPPVTMPVQGTWSVSALSEQEFVLTLKTPMTPLSDLGQNEDRR